MSNITCHEAAEKTIPVRLITTIDKQTNYGRNVDFGRRTADIWTTGGALIESSCKWKGGLNERCQNTIHRLTHLFGDWLNKIQYEHTSIHYH